MEADIDDLLVKSKKSRHIDDLKRYFGILRQFGMKVNPLKCTFDASTRKFLGFIAHERGIEVNSEKITALLHMRPPQSIKEVHKLTGCIAVLSHFIPRSTDRSNHFFYALRGSKEFEWTEQCNRDFEVITEHLSWPTALKEV